MKKLRYYTSLILITAICVSSIIVKVKISNKEIVWATSISSLNETEELKLKKMEYMEESKQRAEELYNKKLASKIIKQREEFRQQEEAELERQEKLEKAELAKKKAEEERKEKERKAALEKERKKKEEERKKQETIAKVNSGVSSESRAMMLIDAELTNLPLLEITNKDTTYSGTTLSVTGEDRDILERLIMGEAGNQGLIGQALVAQCIRDAILLKGYNSVEECRVALAYAGELDTEPSDSVRQAVSFIFDNGGMAVQHRIIYFYAPSGYDGAFHNTQLNVVDYKDQRFFDEIRR